MKTYVTHGLYIALAGLLVALLLFVTGMHSDPAKITLAGYIGTIFHWAFGILFIVLAIRERRAAADPVRGFTYGQALWAGVATALWTAIFDLVWLPLYVAVINPHFNEVLQQAQSAKLEASGASAERIDQAERIQHYVMNAPVEAGIAALGAVIGGIIIALIAAAFFQRQAEPARA